MDWTRRSPISGNTKRMGTIRKCSAYSGTGGKRMDTIRQSGEGLIGCHGCDSHLDNNLCMFCRGTGHFTDKCPKKSSKAKTHTPAAEKSVESSRMDSNLGASPKSKKE